MFRVTVEASLGGKANEIEWLALAPGYDTRERVPALAEVLLYLRLL